MTEEQKQEIESDGYKAGKAGAPYLDNPYTYQPHRKIWGLGHLKGMEVRLRTIEGKRKGR